MVSRVAVMQRNPVRERLGLSDRGHGVHQYRVVLAEDAVSISNTP
jgi:hypothetical protein